MTLLMVSPHMRGYDPKRDAVDRRCFQIARFTYFPDLTQPNPLKIEAGALVEMYVEGGFLVTGLVPEISVEDRAQFGPMYRRLLEEQSWGSFFEKAVSNVRANTKLGLEKTCLERMAYLHTYDSVQLIHGAALEQSLLEEYGFYSGMSLNDVRLGKLRPLVEAWLSLHAPVEYGHRISQKTAVGKARSAEFE